MKHKFEKYCKDYTNIENYQKAKADNFKGWECHHRLETHTSDGERREVDISRKELIALGMYYNRPAEELIFLRKGEHTSLRKVSTETRQKLGGAKKGNKYALGCNRSEETRNKMREAMKGKNTWIRGRHWYNNGKENKYCYECPEGFVSGMLK